MIARASQINANDTLREDETLRIDEEVAKPASASAARSTIYYLAWRFRPTHPWQSEEFVTRFEAHAAYLDRLGRKMEVYLTHREPSLSELYA